jgi:hypothetical protein
VDIVQHNTENKKVHHFILEIEHQNIQRTGLQQEKKTVLQNAENGQIKAIAH